MKNIKKSAVLIAAIGAMAALAVPSMASAAVWGPVGTTGALDSANASTSVAALGGGWNCTSQHLAISVRTPASSTLDVTAATFSGCSGTGTALSGCTVSLTATGLPWTMTAPSTSNATLNVANVNGAVSGACSWNGAVFHYSGSLVGGVWNASTHSVLYTSATGLTFAGIGPMRVSGTFRNPTQTLTLV